MKRHLLNLFLCFLLAGCTGAAAAYSLPSEEPSPRQAAPIRAQPLPIVEQPAIQTEGPGESEIVSGETKIVSGETKIVSVDAQTIPSEIEIISVPKTSASSPAIPPTAATAVPNVYAFGPLGFPAHINPLTGLPAADPGLLERRPMAIKVTHFPRSVRPQWGLSLADHVYEYLIGDHMTRFIGIFYGTDASMVGPVRSARLFDEQVLRMYKAIFVFGWADDPVAERLTQPDIHNSLVIERPDNCPPLCRSELGHGYNNLFADTHLVSQYISERGTNNDRPNLDGLRFEMEIPKSGSPGEALSIKFSNVSYHQWQYDPISGQYLRSQEIEDDRGQEKRYAPLTDSLTGKQLAADNLLILRTRHEIFYQSASTTILDMPFNGAGSGYALRDGQIYPVAWTRPAADALPTLALPNGRHYPLKPGNVWFEILGESSTLEPVSEGAWSFELRMP